MISIVIPTYNEIDNITRLIPKISGVLEGQKYELIIVDDNSPDGTADAVQKLSKDYPITILKRNGKLGLASAVLHGFQYAKGDILGVIDADLQHPPEYMKEFIYSVSNEYDIVIGSRYVEGGKIEGWSKFRYLVSKGAILLSRPLTSIKDPVSGYFFLKRDVIDKISFNPIGYKILLEILIKGSYDTVGEIPYTFKIRKKGKSKLGRCEYIDYLKLLYSLYKFRSKRMLSILSRDLNDGE